jgi:hypothetical protein
MVNIDRTLSKKTVSMAVKNMFSKKSIHQVRMIDNSYKTATE